MALKIRAYDEIEWVNIWDQDISETWVINYFKEYNDSWPNVREEARPVPKEGKTLSKFTLKSLTKEQVAKVDRMEDKFSRMREICAYGCTNWTGLFDENGNEWKPKKTKDNLGERLTEESLDFLGFFGFIDLPILNIVSVKVLSLTRS